MPRTVPLSKIVKNPASLLWHKLRLLWRIPGVSFWLQRQPVLPAWRRVQTLPNDRLIAVNCLWFILVFEA